MQKVTTTSWARGSTLAYACLIAGAVSLFAYGPFQLYPPIGWVDPGLYISWFMSPAENFVFRNSDYHGTRLAFVTIGAFLYRFFNPVEAQAILVTLYYVVALVAIYRISGEVVVDTATRFAICAIFAINPLFVATFVRGYVDGPAISFGLLGLAGLLSGLRRQKAFGFMVSGGATVAAVATHPYAGGLIAVTALFLILKEPGRLKGITAFAMGGGAIFLILSLAGYALGLPFTLLFDTWSDVSRALQRDGSAFLLPLSTWMPLATRLLIFPLIGLLVWIGWPETKNNPVQSRLLQATLVPLALIVATAAASTFVIQHAFYASYLVLALVPAMMIALHSIARLGNRSLLWCFSLLAVATSAITLLFGLSVSEQARSETNLGMIWVGLALGVIVIIAGRSRMLRVFPLGLAILMFGIAGSANRDTASAMKLPGSADFEAQQRMLGKFRSALSETGAVDANYAVWLSRSRFTSGAHLSDTALWPLTFQGEQLKLNSLDSLAASLGWNKVWLGYELPQITVETRRTAAQLTETPRPLVMLCANSLDCEQGIDGLRDLGVIVTVKSRQTIDDPVAPNVVLFVADISASIFEAPPIPLILANIRAGLEEGPAADAIAKGEIFIKALHKVSCDQTSLPICTVVFELSTDEVATTQLRFTRQGALWNRAR